MTNQERNRDPFIVCAAILFSRTSTHGDCNELEDLLIVGPRHYDGIMRAQVSKHVYSSSNPHQKIKEKDQGFIDQYGKFYNRVEALKIAKANNQIRFDLGYDSNELFSEMLY